MMLNPTWSSLAVRSGAARLFSLPLQELTSSMEVAGEITLLVWDSKVISLTEM